MLTLATLHIAAIAALVWATHRHELATHAVPTTSAGSPACVLVADGGPVKPHDGAMQHG